MTNPLFSVRPLTPDLTTMHQEQAARVEAFRQVAPDSEGTWAWDADDAEELIAAALAQAAGFAVEDDDAREDALDYLSGGL